MLLKGLQFENKGYRKHLEITASYFKAATSGHEAWTPFSEGILNNTGQPYGFTVITANTVQKIWAKSFTTELMAWLLKIPPF